MATVVAGGATPRSFTSGSFDLTTLQNGPTWTFVFTPSLVSTDAAYSGFKALLTTNDNGGLWVVDRRIELYNGAGAGTLVGNSAVLTWSASTAITVTINLAAGSGASSIVVSGAATGNGTTTFTTSGTYFTSSILGVGQFTNSNTFLFLGTIGAVTDGVNVASSSAAASCSATAVALAITTGLAAAVATCTATVAGSVAATSSAAATCTAAVVARAITTGLASAAASGTASVAGGLGVHSVTSSIAIFGLGASTLTAPGGTPLTGGGTIDPDGRTVTAWNPPSSGTTFYATIARPKAATKSISDNRGNTYTQIDVQNYQPDSSWETAVYEVRPATGGAGTIVTIPGVVGDEATLMVTAIQNGIVRHQHVTGYSTPATTITSPSASSAGRALFVFSWLGDGPTLGGGGTEGVPLVVNATNPAAVVVDSRIVNHNNGWIQLKQWAVPVDVATTLSLTVNQGRSEGARWYVDVYQETAFVSVAGTSSAAASCLAASLARAAVAASSTAAASCAASAVARAVTTGIAAAGATCTDASTGASVPASASSAAICSATAVALAITTGTATAAASGSATSAVRAVVGGAAAAAATCSATSGSIGVDLASAAATCSASAVARAVTTAAAICHATTIDLTAGRPARASYSTHAGATVPTSLVAGDLEPDLLLPLTEPAESGQGIQAIDLTGASSVHLRWRRPDTTVVLRQMTIVDAARGRVRRTWDPGDTDQVGQHRGHVVITWASGEVQTVPSDGGFFAWTVHPQLF